MNPCSVISFKDTKQNTFKGLIFGKGNAKRIIILVHGLGGSAFSMLNVVEKLADKNTAILTFNNRGHDVISRLGTKRKGKLPYGGAAHEVFTDCVDDIDGAIRFAKKQGAREIYLAGHSTGCQKSIYWAAKKGKGVKGIILLAPVSDWAAGVAKHGKVKVARAAKHARALVARGKKHELLPEKVWPEILDAQRFLSLYTPDSVEETFSYAQPIKNPTLLKKVSKPILVLWAGKDEYNRIPAKDITAWFSSHLSPKSQLRIIKGANHGFKKSEIEVARCIRGWLHSIHH